MMTICEQKTTWEPAGFNFESEAAKRTLRGGERFRFPAELDRFSARHPEIGDLVV